jgi:hypothetical protein
MGDTGGAGGGVDLLLCMEGLAERTFRQKTGDAGCSAWRTNHLQPNGHSCQAGGEPIIYASVGREHTGGVSGTSFRSINGSFFMEPGKRMEHGFKKLTDFLVGMGIEQIPHTQKSYLAHLIAVYRDLESQGFPEDVCRAGMFHSIYGTELFQGFTLPLDRRSEIRSLIGDRAERLAYLNCAMNRASFDRALEQKTEPYLILDRISGPVVALSRPDFDDLCRVHLFDWLEQVPRSQEWDYRREAYRLMAERLGKAAIESYKRVYALEQTETDRQG